jgi:hypothetical protein
MRKELPGILEVGRIRSGPYGSKRGNCGAFEVKHNGVPILIIASDGMGWEHVSVSIETRAPTWDEMCWVKDLFWDEDECVLQYHPPREVYVNLHPNCLHLWRPLRYVIPVPPMKLVG